jgi:hypothetical protein
LLLGRSEYRAFIGWAASQADNASNETAMTGEIAVSELQHDGKIEKIFSADDQ